MELSEKLKKRISKAISKKDNPEVYWDYSDEVSDETIYDALQNNDYDIPLHAIEDKLWELNIDHIWDLETNHIKDTLLEFKEDIAKELNIESNLLDFDEIARELRDEFLDLFSVEMDIRGLLRRKDINIRIELLSNYDCINSHWFEFSGGFNYHKESYFADMIKILKLNPAKLKKYLIEKGHKCTGYWPNRSDKKALITYDDYYQEEINRCCGACLLTFIGSMNAYDFLSMKKDSKIWIPKGNNVGFYSSFQGGGSMFEAELQRPFLVDLGKKYDKSGYMGFRLEMDCRKNSYSIDEAYGVTQQFWGGKLQAA